MTRRPQAFWPALPAIPVVLLLACGTPPVPGKAASGAAVASVASTGAAEQVSAVHVERSSRDATLEERLAENVDPTRDRWDTEVLSAAAGQQLKSMAKLLGKAEKLDAASLDGIVDAGFEGPPLRPGPLEDVFEDATLRVRRWDATAAPASHRGPAGLAAALRGLAVGLGPGEIRAAVKVVNIEEGDAFFTTGILYEASRSGTRQQNATWRCRWSYPADANAKPLLLKIELERYEEAEFTVDGTQEGQHGPLFADCTRSAMEHNPSYAAQVLPGINHWLSQVSLIAGMSMVGHHGLAVGDANGDGLEDLYVCDAAGLPNRLYLQRADGTLDDASAGSGVDWLEASLSSLFVDLDNDGDQDLVVAMLRRLLIAENDGSGRFTLHSGYRDAVSNAMSLSAADYDNDGDLDLFLCAYTGDPDDRGQPGPVPYHDATNGGANALLRNDGDFRFSDATVAAGLDPGNHRFSFAAAWDDFDNDGDLDLYVANDFGRNNLYRNAGGRFRDAAADLGVQDVATGMGVTWGDYDRDGFMDVYISNMFSSAGQRVAYQRRFTDAATDATASDIQRMARGNTLFRNAAASAGGTRSFHDVSVDAGVTMGRWAWASKFTDFNNDSWPDLVVANGYVTNEGTDDL